jgi:hypothetical protein
MVFNGMDVFAQQLLDELAAGQPVTLDIMARDAAGGSLLLLLLALHEAASKRQVAVVVTQQDAAIMRLSVPSSHNTSNQDIG